MLKNNILSDASPLRQALRSPLSISVYGPGRMEIEAYLREQLSFELFAVWYEANNFNYFNGISIIDLVFFFL